MSSLDGRGSLLPPNATSIERALEAVTRSLDDISVPLRDLWSAERCPIELLPWLAYALSIDSWNSGWSEQIKRSVVAQAIAIQRIKGTAASVRKVVQAFGGQIAIREAWQMDPPGQPHTFELVLSLNGQGGAPVTARFVDEVIDEVARTKPARSHFTFTQGLSAEAGLGVAGGARPAAYRRLQLEEAA
ncbi:phage tail protein I [Brevundimonas intermedia]|uniref:Phage tail protein I n=1 Tax=Brevundimonas intermedia TaxID=74315 RepID=A0ABQ5T9X3_9CAUL|nr:phage tail protein I [Brevundimonas intermedia]GLK49612.1 phage tail protein I [Brevundimonas intermedia]